MEAKESPRFRGDLIGYKIAVVEAKNKDIQGLSGKVVDETMNAITILHGDRELKILKDQILKLEIVELGIMVGGQFIKGRPEERVKR